ncbi:hypothetical protein [Nitratidesulfovibrio sp. 1201_IL3209]
MRWTTDRTIARWTLGGGALREQQEWDYINWREQDWSILAEYFTHE